MVSQQRGSGFLGALSVQSFSFGVVSRITRGSTIIAERYHFCRHAAEAKLPYFSWHWRFAVFSIAKVIFGKHADPTCSAFCPDSSQVFFELLQNLPWEDHIHIFTASRTWPKRLQDDFGRAMKKTREESMSF
jgi:hypothetical protein